MPRWSIHDEELFVNGPRPMTATEVMSSQAAFLNNYQTQMEAIMAQLPNLSTMPGLFRPMPSRPSFEWHYDPAHDQYVIKKDGEERVLNEQPYGKPAWMEMGEWVASHWDQAKPRPKPQGAVNKHRRMTVQITLDPEFEGGDIKNLLWQIDFNDLLRHDDAGEMVNRQVDVMFDRIIEQEVEGL